MKTIIAIAALVLSQGAMAQMVKCTDAAGKTTYANRPCQEFGLKDAGEIKERLQVTPAPPPSTRPAAAPRPSQEASRTPPAAKQEEKPERRCFTTRNAKGATVTRCNDKPDEPAD
jgi:hypothetical protein